MEDNNNINDIVDLTVPGTFKHKVKSILNKAAEFSSKHMFDGSIDTVYNSDGGNVFIYNHILNINILLFLYNISFSYLNSPRAMDNV